MLSETRHGAVRVVALGNVLTGDDAFGAHVLRRLEAGYRWPPSVALLDEGTPGLSLVHALGGADAIVLVDCVHGVGPAGGLRVFREAELLATPARARTNPHQPALGEALATCELHGSMPAELVLVGVVPACTATGVGLSAEVAAAVPAAVDTVVGELRALGIAAEQRDPPGHVDIWWEAPTPERSAP